MYNTGKIEIEFDDVSNAYYASWYPPKAIGSGKTKLDALRDLQEAIHFGADTMIESRGQTLQNGDKGGNQTEYQEEIKSKAREIVSLLPKRNCGECGFDNCGGFAMAVAEGKASPYGCRKAGEIGERISHIMGIDSPEKGESHGRSIGFPFSEFFRRKNLWMGHGKGRRRRRAHETFHHWFHHAQHCHGLKSR